MKVIALSSNVALVMREMSNSPVIRHTDTGEKDVFRWINRITATNSDRFVLSPEHGKLEKLVKDTKINKYMRTKRIDIS